MQKYVLVVNCGSSSLKYAVVDAQNGDTPLSGNAERLTGGTGEMSVKFNGNKESMSVEPGTHAKALEMIVSVLQKHDLMDKICAVGHRVVQGGAYFSESVAIDDEVRAKLVELIPLAPVHNPAHVSGIDGAMKAFPNLKHVAVFDTAFHAKMPERAYLYPLPYNYYTEHKVRRYGFHGTSFRYVSARTAEVLGKTNPRLVICHLGNGASIAAVDGDHSVDTTMGLTPLEGIVHGTRSGDIDPAIHGFMARQMGMNIEQIEDVLWKKSGLLGLSGISNDCREIEEAVEEGNEAAKRTMDVYCYRLAKHIASQMVAVGGIDALVFTGGIGENSDYVRREAVKYLAFMGIALDEAKNKETFRGKEGHIESSNSSTPVLVIPTNEELLIARDAARLAS